MMSGVSRSAYHHMLGQAMPQGTCRLNVVAVTGEEPRATRARRKGSVGVGSLVVADHRLPQGPSTSHEKLHSAATGRAPTSSFVSPVQESIADLGRSGMAVFKNVAAARRLSMGTAVPGLFRDTGLPRVRVRAYSQESSIYEVSASRACELTVIRCRWRCWRRSRERPTASRPRQVAPAGPDARRPRVLRAAGTGRAGDHPVPIV